MKRIIVFVLLMLAASSVFGQFQRVQQIKAGTGVTISPTSGYGVVTITASNAFTGGGATGQVTFWTSATGLSGDTGFTKSGTGATFDLTLGHALIAPIWHPAADSTTALQINAANGTTNIVNIDTTNGFTSLASSISTKTASGNIAVTDSTILCDATTGANSQTLPAVATSTGRIFRIKKIDGTVNACTVVGTIDGATNYMLYAQYDFVVVQSNGTSWFILGR